MKLKEYFAEISAQQHRRPHGLVGWLIGEQMVRQHQPETIWTLDLLDIQPTDALLEVGCGAGQALKLAAARATAGRIIGIDISTVMVRAASKRNVQAVRAGRVTVLQGTVTALPFKDEQFDKIMAIHTVYFWSQLPLALHELYRVLKREGGAVITLSTGKMNNHGELELWPPFQSLLQEQLIPEMQHEGFRVVRLEQGHYSRQYNNIAVIAEK